MRLVFGDQVADVTAKLRRRGWAGSWSVVEIRYLRAHPTEWWGQQRQNGLKSRQEGRETASGAEKV